MKKALVLSPFLVALFALSAVADDTLVKFRGGIGVLTLAGALRGGRAWLLRFLYGGGGGTLSKVGAEPEPFLKIRGRRD